MKMSFFFLFISAVAFSNTTFSQGKNLSIDVENVNVKEVFRMIENQTSYRFFYNDQLTDLDRIISLSGKDLPIEKALDEILTSTDMSYTIMDNNLIVIAPAKVLQQITVTGKVVDAASGESLPGVYVMIQGTNTGGITDVNGNFSVNVADRNATLVFSFVGYASQSVPLAGQAVINVSLEPETTALEEVIVVGYGTQKKVTVTGAITTLGSDDVKITPQANLTQGLAGSLSGVIINQRGGEPGRESTDIFIRGRSTNQDTRALYVIDGIVRDYQGLDRLDPNEIESITVLKDASAAIYGSRAANGVVLVTTKRGQIGKPRLEFSYNHGFSQATRIPKTASSGQYAEAVNLRNEMLGQAPRWSEEEVQKFYDGSDPIRYPNTNWYDLVYRDWKNQDKVNLSINGGNETVKYFISGGYLFQGSPYNKSFTYNKQYNFRSNIDATINQSLTLSLDVAGRMDDIMTSRIDYNHVVLGYPYQLPINPNGSYGEGRTGENAVAMVREKDYGYVSTDRGILTSSLSAVWKLPWVNGLSLTGTFAYDYNKSYGKTAADVWYYYLYNADTDTYTKKQGSRTATPNLSVSFSQGNSITANARLAYVRSFNQHNLDAFIGYEQNTTHDDNLSAGRSAYLSFAIEELFAGTADKSLQSSDGSASNTARQHLFGRVAYDFAKKYLLQFQMRYDGSQNFPKDNRWGFFPGVSAGWTISEESFMEGLSSVLSYMKFRGSWGQLGNDRVGAYQYLTTYAFGNNASFGGVAAQGLVQSGAPNPNITWEVATTTDVGVEARFWGQLLGLDIDLFKTRRNNILAQRDASVPNYTGLTLPSENIGIIDNKGIEIQVSHRSKIGNLTYNLSGNFTYVRNEVIDIDETPQAEPYQNQTGHPIGAPLIYIIDYDYSGGVFDTDEEADAYGALIAPTSTGAGHLVRKDMNGDGKINTNDRVRQDWTATPEIVFGLNMNFDYKGFDLSLNWQGQSRAKAPGLQTFNFDPVQWGNFNPWLLEDGWTPDNPDGSKPRPGLTSTEGFNGTEFIYFDRTYLRLKNIQLGYTLPRNVVSKIRVDGCRVYLSGTNLFSIDKLKDLGVDPEQITQNTVPPERIINLGLTLTF